MPAKNGFIYNGIHYVSWWHDEYTQSPNATASMDALQRTGANWASVLTTWYWDPSSGRIRADQQKTPLGESVSYAVEQLHLRGLQVMLKPHVDGPPGVWRGHMKPAAGNISAWLQDYKNFIEHYADIALQSNAEGLVIGTELKMLSAANEQFWSDIIDSVRAKYSGLLTYAANANWVGDEFMHVVFWDQLDLIGLDGYFPLTTVDRPSMDELVSAWTRNYRGQNMVEAVQQIQATHNKPVIFTEIGYRSVAGCNTQPWCWDTPGVYDPQQQANCYEAFFEVWSRHASCMQGAFWWDWPVTLPPNSASGYTPQHKPAQKVLEEWFGPA